MFRFILILYIPYSSTDRRNYNRRLLVIRKCQFSILYIPYSSTDRRNYNRRLLVIRKCQFSTQVLKLLMH